MKDNDRSFAQPRWRRYASLPYGGCTVCASVPCQRGCAKLLNDNGAADQAVIDAVQTALTDYGDDGSAPLALAFSGGLDSTVLAHAVIRVAGAARCVALHIHHGLSEQADAWLAHCEQQARKWRIAFDARRVNVRRVPRDAPNGVEAAARTARYTALTAMCAEHGAPVLWLGHHADDQAETVLLQLLRGAGLPGLSAMPAVSRSDAGLVRVRPLLGLSRATLASYAKRHRLDWINDDSNEALHYRRNLLRHLLMPQIKAHFPGYRQALARVARHLADAQAVLDEVAASDLASANLESLEVKPARLSWLRLRALSPARLSNVLRYWLRQQGLPAPPAARLAALTEQLRNARADAALTWRHAGHTVRVYRKILSISSAPEADEKKSALTAGESHTLIWRGETVWPLPLWRGSLLFAPVAADDPDGVAGTLLSAAPLIARARAGGERLREAPNRPRRPLKKLFQEHGVPAWWRNLPLIYLGDRLLFVPGMGLNCDIVAPAALCPAESETYYRLMWREEGGLG